MNKEKLVSGTHTEFTTLLHSSLNKYNMVAVFSILVSWLTLDTTSSFLGLQFKELNEFYIEVLCYVSVLIFGLNYFLRYKDENNYFYHLDRSVSEVREGLKKEMEIAKSLIVDFKEVARSVKNSYDEFDVVLQNKLPVEQQAITRFEGVVTELQKFQEILPNLTEMNAQYESDNAEFLQSSEDERLRIRSEVHNRWRGHYNPFGEVTNVVSRGIDVLRKVEEEKNTIKELSHQLKLANFFQDEYSKQIEKLETLHTKIDSTEIKLEKKIKFKKWAFWRSWLMEIILPIGLLIMASFAFIYRGTLQ